MDENDLLVGCLWDLCQLVRLVVRSHFQCRKNAEYRGKRAGGNTFGRRSCNFLSCLLSPCDAGRQPYLAIRLEAEIKISTFLKRSHPFKGGHLIISDRLKSSPSMVFRNDCPRAGLFGIWMNFMNFY